MSKNDISLEEVSLFRQTLAKTTSFFDKDTICQVDKKHSKFLKYRLILDATYSASDKLNYPGSISKKDFKKMQQGTIFIDATIDLHGKNLEESCISLANFLHYHQHKKYLHIIHGKGYGSDSNGMSKLKTQVAIYLKDHPQVAAFCSCPQNFGGTGAVFARLKQ